MLQNFFASCNICRINLLAAAMGRICGPVYVGVVGAGRAGDKIQRKDNAEGAETRREAWGGGR
jgi:hypothetical protein